MNLLQALKWADDNAQGEVVDRLRSRKVAKVLSATVRTYAAWIREEGERSNTCTYNVLGEVCGYCECKRKASNILLKVAGKSFRCSCGCNIFQKLDPDNENEYTCNACHATYESGGA